MAKVPAGKLYVVATPIGNLDDLSPRAARILCEVDVIAAEDTRVSRRLLKGLNARARLLSYREHNERTLAPKLIERIEAGGDVAVISDAGTPGISDPGYRLVRAAAACGIEVVAVPGPSALIALLSISGLPTDHFSFEAFPPGKAAARRKMLAGLKGCGRTVVFYESPRRVLSLLADVAGELADPVVAVGRELTKLHEEVLRGRASQVRERLAGQGPRGEFCIAVYVEKIEAQISPAEVESEVSALLRQGLSVKDAAARLKSRGIARRAVYEAARALRSS